MTWRDNIGPLSKAFRVYAADFPGHGDSDKPDFDYATDTILRFVAHFMETLKLDRAAIIGTSVGGAVGLMVALRFPQLVSSLVLVDSLKHPTMPLMVVWGTEDQILPVSHAYRASEAAPQARLHVFDQCGHWPHMEKAPAFNSLVLEFLWPSNPGFWSLFRSSTQGTVATMGRIKKSSRYAPASGRC